MRERIRAAGLIFLTVALACGSQSTNRAATERAPEQPSATERTLPASTAELAPLFGGSTADAEQSLQWGPEDYRKWVRKQLDIDAFYDITNRLVFTLSYKNTPSIVGRAGLEVGQSKRRGPFYYRTEPCADNELEEVVPWWSSETALVCSKDHKPTVLRGAGGQACDVTWTSLEPSSGCACGPHLMFCGPRNERYQLIAAAKQEARDTVKYLIQTGRPFSEILTGNITVRNGFAEFWHERVRFFRTGEFKAPDLDLDWEPRPRDEIFKGGVLSTPLFLFGDGQRLLVKRIWGDFLCSPLRGAGVDPHTLLTAFKQQGANSHNLRAEAHMVLTKTDGCKNCHAQLEYGARGFSNWTSALFGMHYTGKSAERTDKPARVYVGDHEGFRGEGPPTLEWLGATLAEQPEFTQCMTSRVANYFYEGNPVPFEVEQRLLERFRDGQNMGRLIEDAVVARIFGPGALK